MVQVVFHSLSSFRCLEAVSFRNLENSRLLWISINFTSKTQKIQVALNKIHSIFPGISRVSLFQASTRYDYFSGDFPTNPLRSGVTGPVTRNFSPFSRGLHGSGFLDFPPADSLNLFRKNRSQNGPKMRKSPKQNNSNSKITELQSYMKAM